MKAGFFRNGDDGSRKIKICHLIIALIRNGEYYDRNVLIESDCLRHDDEKRSISPSARHRDNQMAARNAHWTKRLAAMPSI